MAAVEDHHLQATRGQGDQEAGLHQKEEAQGEVDREEARVGKVREELEKAEGEGKRGQEQEEEGKEEARELEEKEEEEEKREEEQEENQEDEQEREEEEEQEGRGQWKSLWSGGSLPTRIRSATLTLGSETSLCLETLCRTR